MGTQLLCTFTKKNWLDETIDEIKDTYNISFGRIFVLEDVNNPRDVICTYNVDSEKTPGQTMRHTISIHRKKHTNTLYTINALNYVVSLLNDGKMDKNFEVDWKRYQNTLLVGDDDEGFKKIETKIYKMIDV